MHVVEAAAVCAHRVVFTCTIKANNVVLVSCMRHAPRSPGGRVASQISVEVLNVRIQSLCKLGSDSVDSRFCLTSGHLQDDLKCKNAQHKSCASRRNKQL